MHLSALWPLFIVIWRVGASLSTFYNLSDWHTYRNNVKFSTFTCPDIHAFTSSKLAFCVLCIPVLGSVKHQASYMCCCLSWMPRGPSEQSSTGLLQNIKRVWNRHTSKVLRQCLQLAATTDQLRSAMRRLLRLPHRTRGQGL